MHGNADKAVGPARAAPRLHRESRGANCEERNPRARWRRPTRRAAPQFILRNSLIVLRRSAPSPRHDGAGLETRRGRRRLPAPPRRQAESGPGPSVSAGLQGHARRRATGTAASTASRVDTVGTAARVPLLCTSVVGALQDGARGIEPQGTQRAFAIEAHRRRFRCCARNARQRVQQGRRVRRRPASVEPTLIPSARSFSGRGASRWQQRRNALRARTTKKPRRITSEAAEKPRNSALSPEDHPARRTRAARQSRTRRIRCAGAGRRPRGTLPACEYSEPRQHSNSSTPTRTIQLTSRSAQVKKKSVQSATARISAARWPAGAPRRRRAFTAASLPSAPGAAAGGRTRACRSCGRPPRRSRRFSAAAGRRGSGPSAGW